MREKFPTTHMREGEGEWREREEVKRDTREMAVKRKKERRRGELPSINAPAHADEKETEKDRDEKRRWERDV